MEWFLMPFQKYAEFNGRSRRKEYWMFYLFNTVISAILTTLSSIRFLGSIFAILASLYGLAILIPGLAVTFRRLHDIGKSGAYILVNLIPVIGQIWFLILVASDGTPGPNQYGPSPKDFGGYASYNYPNQPPQ